LDITLQEETGQDLISKLKQAKIEQAKAESEKAQLYCKYLEQVSVFTWRLTADAGHFSHSQDKNEFESNACMFGFLIDTCTRIHFQENTLTEAQQMIFQLKQELEKAKSGANTPPESEQDNLETTEEAKQVQKSV